MHEYRESYICWPFKWRLLTVQLQNTIADWSRLSICVTLTDNISQIDLFGAFSSNCSRIILDFNFLHSHDPIHTSGCHFFDMKSALESKSSISFHLTLFASELSLLNQFFNPKNVCRTCVMRVVMPLFLCEKIHSQKPGKIHTTLMTVWQWKMPSRRKNWKVASDAVVALYRRKLFNAKISRDDVVVLVG